MSELYPQELRVVKRQTEVNDSGNDSGERIDNMITSQSSVSLVCSHAQLGHTPRIKYLILNITD